MLWIIIVLVGAFGLLVAYYYFQDDSDSSKLKTCPACNKSVSKNATSCPHCGEPLTKEKKKTSLFTWLVLVLFVVGLVSQVKDGSSDSSSKARHKAPTPKVEQLSGTGEVWQVTYYVKQHLKDPDSYQSREWTKMITNSKGNYSVTHEFGAKNGFGGYNTERWMFELDKDGHILNVVDMRK